MPLINITDQLVRDEGFRASVFSGLAEPFDG